MIADSIVHESFFTSVGQVVILVVASLLTSLVIWVARRQATAIARSDKAAKNTEAILAVLVTPEPTGLVPHPAPGLVDVVAGHTKTLRGLSANINEIDNKVKKLFPNGENTNDPGDLMARTAKAQGTWLEETPDHPIRRKDDKKEQ